MIELFAPKQIRCEHCGFEFMMTGFGSAAKIVCLACGKETTLPTAKSAGRKAEFPEIVSKSATESLLCSVEQCPLLTESEAGSAVAEQVRQRLRKKARRRRNIMAWTVMLQVCVLLGVALFVTKPMLFPDEGPATNRGTASTNTEPDAKETVAEIPPPVQIAPPPPSFVTHLPETVEPSPALPEVKMTQGGERDNVPLVAVIEPENAVPPSETTHVPFSSPAFELPNVASGSENSVPDFPFAPLSPTEPMTLEVADRLLESAKATLVSAPENSIRQVIRAAKIYEELGQALPDSLYWVMGSAFAQRSWGEPLLESSPAIESMTLSADNRYLLAQLRDKTVWLWDLQSPKEERQAYLLDQGTVEYVKFVFSPDLRWIIGGQKSGVVRIWDMSLTNPGESLITFAEQVPDLQDLQISANGHWLAAFGNTQQLDHFGTSDMPQHSVFLWNLRQMEAGIVPKTTPVPALPQPVRVIRFSPNSDRLAIGSHDRVVRIYDLAARSVSEEPFVLRGHQLDVTQIVFAPCGQWVATGSQDNSVRLWNLTGSKLSPESATLLGHIGWISALTIDKTGAYVLSGSYDRTIRIWNVAPNRIAALNAPPVILKMNLGVPESLSITQDGDKMVVLGSEGSLGIYHLPSLLEEDSWDGIKAVTFRNSGLSISKSLLTTDSQLLIFSYEHLSKPSNNGIRLWALQNGTQSFVR